MKKIDYRLAKESFHDMASAGRVNPSLEITFRDQRGEHTHKIGAGYSDAIAAFQEDTATFILSHNPALGYAGLEAFEGDQKTGEVFLQGEQLNEVFEGHDPGMAEMCRTLQDFI